MSTQVKDDNSADSSRKISIRFFNDHEVRAFWDEENSKWWFSATDIIGAVNNEADYTKAGNYWRWLKRKLKLQGFQFVSSTHKLKITAADRKKYSSDIRFTLVKIFIAANFNALVVTEMAPDYQKLS